MDKVQQTLNPVVFIKDENDPAFRTHMIQRAEEAMDSRNRLPLSELKRMLSKYQR
jgi:hypothetical protein